MRNVMMRDDGTIELVVPQFQSFAESTLRSAEAVQAIHDSGQGVSAARLPAVLLLLVMRKGEGLETVSGTAVWVDSVGCNLLCVCPFAAITNPPPVYDL